MDEFAFDYGRSFEEARQIESVWFQCHSLVDARNGGENYQLGGPSDASRAEAAFSLRLA